MQSAAPLKSEQEIAKSSSSFSQIFELAKNAKNDEKAAQQLSKILSHVCIDVRDSTGTTPAGKLAKEGNKDAAALLMKLGASVNHIAAGAACGGYRDYAEYLRKNHGAHVNNIAKGAALGGHRDYAEYLWRNYGANVTFIAEGAAQGGYRDYAEHLRQNYGVNVVDIAVSAAWGGHRDYAEYLRQKYAVHVYPIARGAASGGYWDYAEYLQQNHGASVDDIARGAAAYGHREYAEYLRQNRGARFLSIAGSAAWGGHRDYAEYLRKNHNEIVNFIAIDAAAGGHPDYAEYLRKNHGADASEIARSAAHAWNRNYVEYLWQNHSLNLHDIVSIIDLRSNFLNIALALHELSFMKNHNFRTEIAKAINDQKLVPYDITKLVPKAQKIAELRPKYNYDQCIALGNREIQIWYLQCAVLINRGKLDPGLFSIIATYLSPLTYQEAKDLYEKSRFDMFQKLLVKGIDQYCAKARVLYFFDRDRKAEAFSVACARAKDKKELIGLLTQESKRLNDEKAQRNKQVIPYNDLIAKHVKRFN